MGPANTSNSRTLGNKSYELTNHLGNVMAVVTDDFTITTDGVTNTKKAEVIRSTDYYPFGLEQPGTRATSHTAGSSAYRYGFNGKERDNSFGNVHYDYGFRIYNPEIGKFLSVDPLTSSYPWYTPYQFAGNMPIVAIDLDGLEEYIVHQRSFAPWDAFGDLFLLFQKSFRGDDRGFSLLDHTAYTPASRPWENASSRLYGASKISLGNAGFVDDYNFQTSSITMGKYMFIGNDSEARAPERQYGNFDGSTLKTQIEGSDPLIWNIVAPDIEWASDLKFGKTTGKLHVHGEITGRNFPAYESFIEDAKGTRVFLTTIMAGENGNRLELGPELLNPFYDYSENINMFIHIDDDGNFTGQLFSNGKSYSIDEWNTMHKSKPAAKDFDEKDRMSND